MPSGSIVLQKSGIKHLFWTTFDPQPKPNIPILFNSESLIALYILMPPVCCGGVAQPIKENPPPGGGGGGYPHGCASGRPTKGGEDPYVSAEATTWNVGGGSEIFREHP